MGESIAGVWGTWRNILDQRDYDQLFTLFGDKNSKIALAITEKGVPTNASATGDQMAANIRAIETKSDVSGTGTSYVSAGRTVFNITGLPFIPRYVLITFHNFNGNIAYDSTYDANVAKCYAINRSDPPDGWRSWSTDVTRTGNSITFYSGSPNLVTNFNYVAVK